MAESSCWLNKGETQMETKLWADLSDDQAEKVVGGVGVIHPDAEGGFAIFGAGWYGWFGGLNHWPGAGLEPKGLLQAGFDSASTGTIEAGPNAVVVPK
jgi:hypothetical protein